jgi:microcystin-dependent protein
MIGEIRMFAGNFAPRGWSFCDGRILSIAQNSALFSILGTTYGGNGTTNFALPDLRGRVPIHPGQGLGLSGHTLGEQSGVENVILLTSQMPAHNHLMTAQVKCVNEDGSTPSAVGAVWANSTQGFGYDAATPDSNMSPNAISVTAGIAGGNQPHSNMQPYLAINFIIATEGIYPSRN